MPAAPTTPSQADLIEGKIADMLARGCSRAEAGAAVGEDVHAVRARCMKVEFNELVYHRRQEILEQTTGLLIAAGHRCIETLVYIRDHAKKAVERARATQILLREGAKYIECNDIARRTRRLEHARYHFEESQLKNKPAPKPFHKNVEDEHPREDSVDYDEIIKQYYECNKVVIPPMRETDTPEAIAEVKALIKKYHYKDPSQMGPNDPPNPIFYDPGALNPAHRYPPGKEPK